MASLYFLSYSFNLLSRTREVQEIFQAADDAAAVIEANARLGAERGTANEKLFLIGTEVTL